MSSPFTKKGDRQLKTNYRPISLLPICGKILEKIVFDHFYSFLNINNLISKYQSGFRPGDSTISLFRLHLIFIQLLKITMRLAQFFKIYLKRLIRFGIWV